MLFTNIFKFKKRELTDSPPDITATNDNWDTVETQLLNRVTKSQIKNNLTETAAGNVLDATQGKILNEQINILADDIDKMTPKTITSVFDIDSDRTYSVSGDANMPSDSKYIIDARIFTSDIRFFSLTAMNVNTGEVYTAMMFNKSEIRNGWKPVATTEKTEILFPYSSGFAIRNGNIKDRVEKCNNLIEVNINVQKTDGSNIGSNAHIGNLPSGYRPNKEVWGVAYGQDRNHYPVIIKGDGTVTIPNDCPTIYLLGTIVFYID